MGSEGAVERRGCGNERLIMKTLPKVLLMASVVSFAVSLTAVGGGVWFGTLKPLSALLFIVAFIVHIVSGLDPQEYAADQRLRDDLMQGRPSPVPGRLVVAQRIAG